ncbi:transient receptor potential cation channel subfamily V member 3-like isoform 3-T3 [Sarcophilus harrisii]
MVSFLMAWADSDLARAQDTFGNTVLHALVLRAQNQLVMVKMYLLVLKLSEERRLRDGTASMSHLEKVRNLQGLTPLQLAAKEGQLELFQCILTRELSLGDTLTYLGRRFCEWSYGPISCSLYDLSELDTTEPNSALKMVAFHPDMEVRGPGAGWGGAAVGPGSSAGEGETKGGLPGPSLPPDSLRSAGGGAPAESAASQVGLLCGRPVCRQHRLVPQLHRAFHGTHGPTAGDGGEPGVSWPSPEQEPLEDFGAGVCLPVGRGNDSEDRPGHQLDEAVPAQALPAEKLFPCALSLAGQPGALLSGAVLGPGGDRGRRAEPGSGAGLVQSALLLSGLQAHRHLHRGPAEALSALSGPCPGPDHCPYDSVGNASGSLFKLTLGLGDLSGPEHSSFPGFFLFVLIIYVILTSVLLLNMLIALMSETATEVSSRNEKIWQVQRAITILDMERCLPMAWRQRLLRDKVLRDQKVGLTPSQEDDLRTCLRVNEEDWEKANVVARGQFMGIHEDPSVFPGMEK